MVKGEETLMAKRGRKKKIPKGKKEDLLKALFVYLSEQDEKFLDKIIRWVNFDAEVSRLRKRLSELKDLKNPTRGQKVYMSRLSRQINNLENLLQLFKELD